jgi:hypothetical protein
LFSYRLYLDGSRNPSILLLYHFLYFWCQQSSQIIIYLFSLVVMREATFSHPTTSQTS